MAEDEEKGEQKNSGFFSRLKSGLVKTRDSLAGGIDRVVHGKAKVGEELLHELEEVLLTADVGIGTTQFILEELRTAVAENRIREIEQLPYSCKKNEISCRYRERC